MNRFRKPNEVTYKEIRKTEIKMADEVTAITKEMPTGGRTRVGEED